MSQFRYVTPEFAVAGQLSAADLAAAAAAGFKTVINNRPDGEGPGQMTDSEARAAAEAADMTYLYFPYPGPATPTDAALDGLEAALTAGQGPVLAFCRTGTRSIRAWAMVEARSRRRSADEIIALAEKAGYDLSGARGALAGLGS